VTVTGTAIDAVRLLVNGTVATLEGDGTFTADVDLLEGANDLVALAADAAGNEGIRSLRVHLDTRAPDLDVLSPAANACLAGTDVTVSGTARDAAAVTVRVGDGTPVTATRDGDAWSATLPVGEGTIALRIEATDESGHVAARVLPLRIDRTKPLITVTEGGAPFALTLLRRAVTPLVRVSDADPNATLAVTLDGAPYTTATLVSDERTHLLKATATDCAGNISAPFELAFTIDRTPPSIVSIAPASGASVGTRPPLTGTLSEPATLTIDGTSLSASVNGTAFSLDAPLGEGLNELALLATDPAGNSSRIAYALRVDTTRPFVEIVESGLPIAAGALFNRVLTPVIRVSDADATLAATLNGQPFAPGASVSADATYTLVARATDAFGRESDEATASFTIDRTPPRIVITAPLDGSAASAEVVEVRGTVDGDAQSVFVNGTAATLTGTTFTASVRVEEGTTVLAATAVDRAGNSARAHVAVVRHSGRLALLVTSPPDGMLTNRPTTVVSGQLLNAPPSGQVSINGIDVAVDAAGAFRDLDFPLVEGANRITVTVASSTGEPNAVSVDVIADYTAPRLTVTANGQPLDDGARFAIAPRLALESDEPATLTIDGAVVTADVTLADGGHALTAIARDAAGNETRVDRTLFVGATVIVTGCTFTQLDPPDGAVVFTDIVRINGRSGGAAAVLIDGNAAQVADGSFCGDATLKPGRNEVTIRCADASGNATTDTPVTLVLWRDAEPSIAITSPALGTAASTNSITVAGTVSAGVVSGDVNGLAFTVPPGATTFSVPKVALAPGLNVITARARSGSGRTTIATTRVTLTGGTPQLVITSPIGGTETGAASIDVTGTYVNVDPATIRVAGAPATSTRSSDTGGTFVASVALPPGALTTIIATAGAATATVQVQQVVGAPSIAITAPIDNASLASTFAGPLRVTGTLVAPEGSRVLVNGVVAAISANAFSVDVPLSAAGAPMPILARVTTPDSINATDSVRVLRLAAPLALRDSFPAANATGVDRGAAILLLFNNALDGDTASAAIRVSDSDGTNVAGQLFVDRDAITFAPDLPLRANQTYTIAISTALHDASGAALAAAQALQFTTAAIAPAAPPIVDDLATSGCLSAITLTGRAGVPGARVRLDADGVTLTTVSSATGAFSFTFSFSGQAGFHIARIRELGADGSLSADRALCFRINCELPRVLGATLNRAARRLTIDFSRAMNAATLTMSTIRVVPDGLSAMNGAVTLEGNTATIALDAEVPDVPIALTVAKDVQDTTGAAMAADFTQRFLPDAGGTQQGRGYVAGAVYDATTGRPLANATISIADAVIITNDRGRYSRALAEGAWTIEAHADGYTAAWRQVVVPAGAGVVPIDIRLTRRNVANVLTHGGDTSVTKMVELTNPLGGNVQLTAVGAQSLAGLLPLGWSPLAAAEIVVDDSLDAALSGATLTFRIDAISGQTLSLVRYDPARDEWRVVVAVANAANPIDTAGHYALVYPDAAPHLAHPATPRNGAPLAGVADRCADEPCALRGRSFTLEPRAILPNGRAVATLVTEGETQSYPSGTAVQATIDEQLNLSDGRVLVDAPFATDLLVYRTPAGDTGVADFHLAPTPTASAVMLRDGVERIRIADYPGRLDRGTLLGAEGGRIPGDGRITLDVPPGATLEPLHASTASLSDEELSSFGTIAGFRIAGGFTLSLSPATSLLIPARATLTVANEILAGATTQVLVAGWPSPLVKGEKVPQADEGSPPTFQLVALADPGVIVSGARLFTTRTIDSTQLPIDGIVRDGRYLILVAESPIAFAYGQVRAGIDGPAIRDARVSSPPLGVTSITNAGGLFALPVPALPAPPFSLVARSLPAGDGATAHASTSPNAGAFVPFGVLPLVAQPPQLRSVSPDGGEVPVDAAFRVRAEFDVAIDPASAAGGITVMNLTAGAAMSGSVSAVGNVVTFDPGEPLRAASQYAITIAGSIRGSNGAPFAQTVVKSFTTSSRPRGSTAFNPDRIRITMPDANGRSTIRGIGGALPAGSQAVAVRRGRFFIVAYQATVAADGSFSFIAGGGDPRDAITIDDLIDLQVVDPISHAVVAVLELTPFVRDDARAFIARHDRDTRFVSDGGIVINVPRGAFDTPTLIAVAPASPSSFADVPKIGDELRYATSVELTFDGVAKKRIDVELPIPTGLDPSNRDWLLGLLGTSTRGPRVMIVDLVHASASSFRTGLAATGNARVPTTNAALTGADLRRHLLGINRSGIYAVVDLKTPAGGGLGWGVMEGIQAGFDLFWDTLESLYASHFYLLESRGTIVVPIVTGRPFTVVGVDAATGLDVFTKVYDPIPTGVPGASVDLADPNPDRTGPYPVFASPFRVETLDLDIEEVELTIRDFTATLKNERVVVNTTLAADVRITLFNVTKGLVDATRIDGLEVAGAKGDRIVLLVAERDVDPYAPLSIVFDEAIDDSELESVITIETAPGAGGPFVAITGALRLSTDASGRRVLIEPPASLTRGNRYRIAISPGLANTKGMRIGQTRDTSGAVVGGLAEPLMLELQVRVPGDLRASFDLQSGTLRDQALIGNVLFVAAGDGGIAAYDVADPAGMMPDTAPIARVAGATDAWSLATDHHGRIYATGITALFGVVQSFRLEDFLAKQPAIKGGAAVSYVPGSASSLELSSSSIAGDRVEAYPRKLQLLVQDQDDPYTRDELEQLNGVTLTSTVGEFHLLAASFARDVARPYATQRITVVNETLDLRWSADATVSQPARIAGIVARANDRLRVIRNLTTYGVISLFGYGVGIYDLNAIESNDAPDLPAGYQALREQIRVTRAQQRRECGPIEPEAIPDLTFTPDAAVVTRPGSNALHVLALDVARGVLDLAIDPAAPEAACGERAPIGLVLRDDVRLAKLRERFVALANRQPFVRFTGAAHHRWTIEAAGNAGERGSAPNTRVERDYMLIPANEFGLLVVEIAGDPPPIAIPSYTPLQSVHLVDVIWVPGGAYAVRAIPGRNLAAVTDGDGHVLLVDLARIDERWGLAPDQLFPTAAAVVAGNLTTPDPRIVWRSERPLASGTLAPVVHPRNGYIFAGRMLEKTTSVVSAIDPTVRIVDVKRETDMRAIVPASIAAPSPLAAFRIEVDLPGAMNESLSGNAVTFDVESERVVGAKTEDTPPGWPRAHLRGLPFHRSVPDSMTALRHQDGYNRWISDPVIALADVRASKDYAWPAGSDKNAEGCYACDRPAEIQGHPDVHELFSLGRHFRIRPSPSVFASSPYRYLAEGGRLEAVVPTIAADVVHPPKLRVAAQHPATAEGLLQGTTHLHSGELETSVTDFDFGGRAGWNVDVDRTYRSRTIGLSPLGGGWDASIFKRIRALPNGDVEYREGRGEVWLFRTLGFAQYAAPAGVFLRLTKTDGGWSLIDQQQRLTTFDVLGRLASESDEFFDPIKPGSGNTIHYLYGIDGRLATILDPVGRRTTLTWDSATGLLAEVTDWRARRITYEYDAQRNLTRALLPNVANTSGVRPRIEYGYQSASSSFNDRLEVATNLTTIKDPKEAMAGGNPRVTFLYAPTGDERDRVIGQRWGTGETATITYAPPASATVKDVLGQERRYTLSANDPGNLYADRAHVTEVRETAVPVWSAAPFGQLPPSLTPGPPATSTSDRVRAFAFDSGVLKSSKLEGVRETTLDYQTASGALGLLQKSTTTMPLAAPSPSPSIPAATPIARTFHYQPGSNFLASLEAGGKKVESSEPHRRNTAPVTTNSEIESTRRFDAHGQLTESTSSGGTDRASAGAKGRIDYFDATAPLHQRGLPHMIREGEGLAELETTIEYPSATLTKETDPRGVVTTTESDEWQRPVRVRVERFGDPLVLEQTYRYDASGRLEETTEKKGAELVTTNFTYDVMGRRTSTKTNGVATVGSVTTTTAYDLAARTITTTQPGGAITVSELDSLGRVQHTITHTGSSPIEQYFAYDAAGNQVYASDTLTASASAFDAHGRAVATRAADGTVASSTYDEWGRAKTIKSLADDATTTVAESTYEFTDAGRAKSVSTKVDAGMQRTTSFAWDGGGRGTRTATNGRASAATFDVAGRMKSHAAGAGDLSALTEVFEKSEVKAHSGELPVTTESSEKNGPAYTASMDRNTTGDVVRENVGPLEWKRRYDELGNVTEANVPGRPATKWDVDARGAATKETLPDGATNQFAYDATGAQNLYSDPTEGKAEETSTDRDLVGRPIRRTYPDGTTERIEWDGPRVKSVTDRQNRTQTYVYNAKGQLTEVREGASTVLEVLEYDHAGRLVSWKNAEAEIAWGDFDLDGNAKQTLQTRYKDASGLASSPVVLDRFLQEHRWNEHGERVKFSMPAAAPLGAGWTKWLRQSFDAMGNVTGIARIEDEAATDGVTLMSASYRGAGRPDIRMVFTAGAPIVRAYAYDPASSMLSRVGVSVNGAIVAGSEVAFDGLQKSKASLLGISSGERATLYSYDSRSRVAASVHGAKKDANPVLTIPGRAREQMNAADFRMAQERTPAIDPKIAGAAKVDPPTTTFDEKTGGGHKIAQSTKGPVVRPFGYNGAERIDDGRFVYTFDTKGRLIAATEKATVPPLRRVVYSYSGTGRVVGRRAEYATILGEWKLEDRPQILSADGLPPETTFAWDPITDRLVAVYRAGTTHDPIKQIVHGDAAYDDPLETTTFDPLTEAVTHLYPIYDEAGAGSLQAVLNVRGEVVARNLTNDPYGAGDLALAGAAIDGVRLKTTKTATGAIETVEITLHATEQLDASTIATGARLAVVDATGAVLRTATAPPTLAPDDPFAVRWSLTEPEWTALTAAAPSASALSIAATQTLRASTWSSSTPVMPAPEWATASKPVYTTTALPVEVRESLTTLTTTLAAIPPGDQRTTNLYDVETLSLLGTSADTPLEEILSARLHAHPLTDPLTELNYVRNRWYEPNTGTFLSPDPKGYLNSANLYAFAGGDPVNKRDPTGEEAAVSANGNFVITKQNGDVRRIDAATARQNPLLVQDLLISEGRLSRGEARDLLRKGGLDWAHPYNRPRVGRNLPTVGTWRARVEAAFVSTTGLPPQNREQEIASGAVQIVATVATAFGAPVANRGRVSAEPHVPVHGGDLPVRIADGIQIKYPSTPNADARKSAQGSYIDPLTNQKTYTNATLSADHIIPQSFIKRMPGFSRLTAEQQNAILNDAWNMQGLPRRFNSSKKDQLPAQWETYDGIPLDPAYVAASRGMQDVLLRRIQARIDAYSLGEQ
jgi:RHS repeat-associated protein